LQKKLKSKEKLVPCNQNVQKKSKNK